MMRKRDAIAVAIALAAMSAFSAKAEKADREKPTQVEANRMTSDEARRISIFEGNVVLTKGTMQLQVSANDAIVQRLFKSSTIKSCKRNSIKPIESNPDTVENGEEKEIASIAVRVKDSAQCSVNCDQALCLLLMISRAKLQIVGIAKLNIKFK